jgi:predicted GNAT family acetyltransferase
MLVTNETAYKTDLRGIDWTTMKSTLAGDNFDNGRTPEQLQTSFENSHTAVVACHGDSIVGTARVLSDGVCNAYVVDVWTLSQFRERGIARRMLEILESDLEGQHVCLFTDDAEPVFSALGFASQGGGMSKVVGTWLGRGA